MNKIKILLILTFFSLLSCEQQKYELHTYEVTFQSGEKDTLDIINPSLYKGDLSQSIPRVGFEVIYSGVRSFKQIK